MATGTTRQSNNKGALSIFDSTGKTKLSTFTYDTTLSLEQYLHTVRSIAASTSDEQIDFSGVARAKVLFINPNGVEITVKLESNSNTGFKVSNPTVIQGEVTALYITTGDDAACVEVIVGGPAT